MGIDPSALLRQRGLHVTPQRPAVLRAVSAAPHATDRALGEAPCLTAVDDFGYEVDEAEVIYWGRCPDCVAATAGEKKGST